jgi:hypothetical protein
MTIAQPALEASAAASAASTQAAPLPFKADAADVGFPWGGALLLLLLIVVAVAVKWRSASMRPAWVARWLPTSRVGGLAATLPTDLGVEATTRLNPQVQLHVVRWSGRRILLATSPNMAPVVLDREDGAAADKEST